MRPLALLLLIGCRGSSSAPAVGSGTAPPPPNDAARAMRSVPCTSHAKPTLAVYEEQPVLCWDNQCVLPGDAMKVDPAPPRPSAWIGASEVRMERGVMSVCGDGCRSLSPQLAETIARTDPALVTASTNLEVVATGTTAWRTSASGAFVLASAITKSTTPSQVRIAGNHVIATFDHSGQMFDTNGNPHGTELSAYDPGDIVQLDDQLFIIGDRSTPRLGIFEIASGTRLWQLDSLTGFTLEGIVRVRERLAAALFHDQAGWWIVSFTADRHRAITIPALRHVPVCR